MELGIWNLTDLYESNDKFLADFEKAKKCLENVKKFKEKLVKNDKKIILDYFEAEFELSKIIEKLAVYSFLKNDDDGKNAESVKKYALINDFYAKVNEETAFARPELSSLSEEFLGDLQKSEGFEDFDRVIEDIIRFKKHALSEKEEKSIALVSGFSNTDDVFSVLSNIEMNHGSYVNENGEEIKLTPGTYNMHLNNPNPEIRKQVMENYMTEYGKLNQTFAGLLTSHIKYENYLAKEYGFESVLDMKCYSEEVSPKIMMVNIENVSKHKKLLQDYFLLKKQILGVDEFYTSDVPVSLFGDKISKITYEQAVSDIRNALLVLGEDYVQVFDKAINEGWIDAFPRENKKSGGYTTSTYAEHPYILLNFDGTMDWASAIAHEFGHAMHSYYSAKNQPYPKYDYTLFVAEVVSLTNEILYNKYLLSKTTDKHEKMKLLADFLQLFELNVYDSSMLAEFELFIHDSLANGESLTAEDYNNKYKELITSYFGDGVKLTKGYEFNWSRKSHIYRDYYLYKYSLGLCSACYIANRLLTEKDGKYLEKYRKFLTLGGSMDPVSSLLVADVDVLDSKIYTNAFKVFEDYLEELKKLTEEK